MSVHSKTGKKWSHDLAFSDVEDLSTVDLESKEVVYYHHPYDSLMEGVPLLNALNEPNWNHIKRFKDVHLVHENDSETFSIDFAEDEDTSTNIETPLVDDDVTDTTGFRIGMRNIVLNKVNVLWQSGR